MKTNLFIAFVSILITFVVVHFLSLMIDSIGGKESKIYSIDSKESKIWSVLKDNHSVRKINKTTFTFNNIENQYCSLSGEGSLFFSWKLNDSTNISSTLRLEKIRIMFNEKNEPSIKFICDSSSNTPWYSWWDNNKFISRKIKFAVIFMRKKDWPKERSLPINGIIHKHNTIRVNTSQYKGSDIYYFPSSFTYK